VKNEQPDEHQTEAGDYDHPSSPRDVFHHRISTGLQVRIRSRNGNEPTSIGRSGHCDVSDVLPVDQSREPLHQSVLEIVSSHLQVELVGMSEGLPDEGELHLPPFEDGVADSGHVSFRAGRTSFW
jgi:hypothetical protein